MSDLTKTEKKALHEALDDEYHAWSTYDQVMTDFGEVRPFSNIREAKARHIGALKNLFACYALPVPENPWPGKVKPYASLQEASQQRHLPAFQRCAQRPAGRGRGARRRRPMTSCDAVVSRLSRTFSPTAAA